MPQYEPSPGILHSYTSRLAAFEHWDHKSPDLPSNFVLWIGGLGDGLLTVKYPRKVGRNLPPGWSLVEVLLSSSYEGWTTGSLARDAKELERAVKYFGEQSRLRSGGSKQAKVILMGHSTGCQDSMEYLVGPRNSKTIAQSTLARPAVDGVILQAGISDRESVSSSMGIDAVKTSLETAKNLVKHGQGRTILAPKVTQSIFVANPTAERWVSLISPDGDDDYFSSDLPDALVTRIWGSGGLASRSVPVMVLLSGDDEYMPPHIETDALLAKWKAAVEGGGGVWDSGSGIVKGATHNLNKSSDAAVDDLSKRIYNFILKSFPDTPYSRI